jgi:hypothetical protein
VDASAIDERAFDGWLDALERRHLADLTFPEVRRALQSLSARYVSGRDTLGDAFSGSGKRAAYALYYAPLHFLTVTRVAREIAPARETPSEILDLGCGTGAAGAAWAAACRRSVRLRGIDRSGWAIEETRWTWRQLRLDGVARRGDLSSARLPSRGGVLAAYSVNELDDDARRRLLSRLLEAVERRVRVLVVEPIATRVSPWWPEWRAAVERAGGRADEWRFPAELPERLARFGRAAGLDTRELTARSLWL